MCSSDLLNNINLGPLKSRKAIEAVFKKFNIPVEESKNISLKIRSKIPVGKGMASSTADIGATIGATLRLIKKELSSEEISKLASTIEPTDSIYIEKNSIFNFLLVWNLSHDCTSRRSTLRRRIFKRGILSFCTKRRRGAYPSTSNISIKWKNSLLSGT